MATIQVELNVSHVSYQSTLQLLAIPGTHVKTGRHGGVVN